MSWIIKRKILLWMYLRVADIVFLPVYVIRLFKFGKVCPPIKNKLLLIRAFDLAEKIRTKEITSEEIIRTYIERIKEVNPIINAVIDDRFDDAIADAKKVDTIIAKNEYTVEELKNKFPLLGVPVTIKGSLNVLGMRNTSGLQIRRDIEPALSDADTVKLVRDVGAIPLLTSNVPELCLNWETTNKLIGTTRNPYNSARTVGGSSGGEASLMGAGASLIGIGSDVAGSLRLPAHFCGTWGHKPTPGIVSFYGHYPSCTNEDDWEKVFTVGPLARYATDLRQLLHIIVKPHMKDKANVLHSVKVNKIRFFYIDNMKSILINKPNECVMKAITQVIKHFETNSKNGCEKVDIPLIEDCGEFSCLRLLDLEGVDNLFKGDGEGSLEELFKFITLRSKSELSSIFYGIFRKYYHLIPRKLINNANIKLNELKQQLEDILKNDGVLICPTFPTEAHFHGDIYRKLFNPCYLSVFNSLGLPVTNCPVTFSNNGLPIGLQIVAAPYCDRLTLTVAEEIEKTFGGWQPPQP